MENEIQTLKNIRYTLDGIDVHGFQNLDFMLGCMKALDELVPRLQEVAKRLNKAEQEPTDERNEEANVNGDN